MLNNIFSGIFDSTAASVIEVHVFLICILAALVLGAFLAFVYAYKNTYTKSFLATLVMLPATVCIVIMMVNGNVGTGVAVAGAFSLVRFRSAAGSAKEISAIFIAMTAGLITGMGYLAYAGLFTLIMGLVMLGVHASGIGTHKNSLEKTLCVTIPEDLNYGELLDDVFEKYTSECETVQVKTTNMGSLYKITYNIRLLESGMEKQMIDEIRCRNGNLEVSMFKPAAISNTL